MKKILIASFLLINLFFICPFLPAEDIYRCDGIIQNRPCDSKQSGKKLDNLPQISKISPNKNDSELKGRPNPNLFSDTSSETNKIGSKKEYSLPAKDQSTADLANRSSQLVSQLANRGIKLPDLENDSIRLRVLMNTLCTKNDANDNSAKNTDCGRAKENLQVVSKYIQQKQNR